MSHITPQFEELSAFTTGNPFWGTILLEFSIYRERFGGSKGVSRPFLKTVSLEKNLTAAG